MRRWWQSVLRASTVRIMRERIDRLREHEQSLRFAPYGTPRIECAARQGAADRLAVRRREIERRLRELTEVKDA